MQYEHFNAISRAQKIERWEQCLRVLENLPEHARLHHWNMGKWGIQTDCGTVACAAGHCALDPWFTNQGFALVWSNACMCRDCQETPHTKSASLDPASFFGHDGSEKIFWDDSARPVETVIDEVKAYIAELKANS